MEAAVRLEAPLHTLRAFRQPSAYVQRVAQALLLLLGKHPPSELGVWDWQDVRAGLRDRHLLPLLAAFDPHSVVEATAAAARQILKPVSVERIARVSGPVAQVHRWCVTQLDRVESALDDGLDETAEGAAQADSGAEDQYTDDDFEEDTERQIGDEEEASDRALWRQQQASTVLAGDFDYSILDDAMVSMVVKFLGAGHSALTLQSKALNALSTRIQSASIETADQVEPGLEDDEQAEVETLTAVISAICESGGVQRCISLLGAGSLSTRIAAASLLATIVRQSPDAAVLFKSCGGELADEAGCFDAQKWTEEHRNKPVELGTATTVLSGEGAAQCWGLDLSTETVTANSAFVSDHGEGVALAEGMVCVGVVERNGIRSCASAVHPVNGAQVKAVAERLHSGLDLWNGRRICLLRWERSLVMPIGEEDSSEDSILWRSQVAQTVQEGAFAWEALDEAMLGSVLKYLGSGVLAVQSQAAAALRRRLGNEEEHGGTAMAAVAGQIVSGGGLHRLVDWLASEEPTLRNEGAKTLRLLIAKSAPEAMQDAVAAFAVKLGGQTVLELLDQTMISTRQNGRGYTTFCVGLAGAQNLWGLKVSDDGTVRDVATGSVAATSIAGRQGLRLVSVSGYPAAAYDGSLRDALGAAAADVLAVENSWKGRRLLQIVVHEVNWISNHLSQQEHTRRMEMCDVSAYAYGENTRRTWRDNANGQLGY